jgi:hypothetical protein
MSDKPLTMHPFESAIVRTLEADNARLAAENEKLAEAVLCAALMLSERGLSSAEKCEMAYDYLSEIHATLSGDKHE